MDRQPLLTTAVPESTIVFIGRTPCGQIVPLFGLPRRSEECAAFVQCMAEDSLPLEKIGACAQITLRSGRATVFTYVGPVMGGLAEPLRLLAPAAIAALMRMGRLRPSSTVGVYLDPEVIVDPAPLSTVVRTMQTTLEQQSCALRLVVEDVEAATANPYIQGVTAGSEAPTTSSRQPAAHVQDLGVLVLVRHPSGRPSLRGTAAATTLMVARRLMGNGSDGMDIPFPYSGETPDA